MNTPFGWEVQVCGEYDFSLKGTSLQWIRLLIKKYNFAVNTTFVWTVQIWDEYDFCLKGKSFEYDFCLNGTSYSEYDF